MNKKVNPTLIGAFVVGAVGLLIAAIVIFGSGKFFERRPRAVAFFSGDLQGLSVGSAVNLRGVQVGTVTEIQLRLNLQQMVPVIPVYMEFDPNRLSLSGEVSEAQRLANEPLRLAIKNGLHAKLATQSLVTGQLVVALDLDPNEPRRFVGADPNTVEIPTSESDLEKLKNKLTQLPLDDLATSAIKLLKDTDDLVTSHDTRGLLRSLAEASNNLNGFMTAANNGLPKILTDVQGASDSGRDALAAAQKAMDQLQATLTTADQLLAGDTREALHSAVAALDKANKTLSEANSLVAANSPQRYDIDQALQNLAATTRSLRVFAQDLERRPNSILIGK